MREIISLLLLIFSIKCEDWYDEVNGHSKDDSDYGYAGSANNPFTDFYLCSERKYRAHFLDDDNDTWSEEFTACQPVGNGRYIDGIAINGGKGTSARVNLIWESPPKKEYDIFHPSGYSGTLGFPIQGLYTFGDENYRSGYKLHSSSAENEVAKRVIYNLFKTNYIFNFDYENETEIFNNSKINITILLLNSSKIKFRGKVMIKINNNKVIDSNYKHLVNKNLIKLINEKIGSDFNTIKNTFEELFFNNLKNGDISINFNWLQNKIEIDVGSKIKYDYYAYRGGFRINIYLSDEDLYLLSKVKEIIKGMLSYSGMKIPDSIKELLSNFNSFKKADEIMNFLGIYSYIPEAAIIFKIISDFL